MYNQRLDNPMFQNAVQVSPYRHPKTKLRQAQGLPEAKEKKEKQERNSKPML
jgi:hypothetical protein